MAGPDSQVLETEKEIELELELKEIEKDAEEKNHVPYDHNSQLFSSFAHTCSRYASKTDAEPSVTDTRAKNKLYLVLHRIKIDAYLTA